MWKTFKVKEMHLKSLGINWCEFEGFLKKWTLLDGNYTPLNSLFQGQHNEIMAAGLLYQQHTLLLSGSSESL